MFKDKKIAVIIAAAGSGTRMGGGISKQFRNIEGLPVLTRAVGAFDAHPYVDEIFVVAPADRLELCEKEMLAPYGFSKVRAVLEGGAQRQDSVCRGLFALSSDTDFVLIHDGARPFISEKTISDTIKMVEQRKAAVVAVPLKDTIKEVAGDGAGEVEAEGALYFCRTPDRSRLYAVQTPQAFSVSLLKDAMKKAFAEKFYGTDDSILVERMGQKVYLVMGEPENIKITTAEDMEIGAALARRLRGLPAD